MPFCPKCGYEMGEDDLICYKCGAKITKKRVDATLQPQYNNPPNRNLGKISSIQSKIKSYRDTERNTFIATWLLLIGGVIGWGWATIVYRVDVNIVLYMIIFGVILGGVGTVSIRKEIKKLEDELSSL